MFTLHSAVEKLRNTRKPQKRRGTGWRFAQTSKERIPEREFHVGATVALAELGEAGVGADDSADGHQ